MANSNTSELQLTQLKAPTLALKFLLDNFESITLKQLETEHRLNRSTLYRIHDGEAIPRSYDDYMQVFVSILYAKDVWHCLPGIGSREEPLTACYAT